MIKVNLCKTFLNLNCQYPTALQGGFVPLWNGGIYFNNILDAKASQPVIVSQYQKFGQWPATAPVLHHDHARPETTSHVLRVMSPQ